LSIVEFLYRLFSNWMKKKLKVEGGWIKNDTLYFAVARQMGTIPILLDRRYRVTTIDEWYKIIKSDNLNEVKKWKEDVFDCDNFAMAIVARVNEMYELNSIGIAIGTLKDAETMEMLGKHAYNVIAADVDGTVKLFILEPQTDEIVEAKPSTKIGDRIYETEIVVFG